MLMPVSQSFGPGITGAGTPISLDYLPHGYITAAVTEIGTATFTVQVTLDNIFDATAADYVPVASASWFTVTGAPTADDGYVTFPGPWRAIRINIATNDTGVIFQVAQSTTPRA